MTNHESGLVITTDGAECIASRHPLCPLVNRRAVLTST